MIIIYQSGKSRLLKGNRIMQIKQSIITMKAIAEFYFKPINDHFSLIIALQNQHFIV